MKKLILVGLSTYISALTRGNTVRHSEVIAVDDDKAAYLLKQVEVDKHNADVPWFKEADADAAIAYNFSSTKVEVPDVDPALQKALADRLALAGVKRGDDTEPSDDTGSSESEEGEPEGDADDGAEQQGEGEASQKQDAATDAPKQVTSQRVARTKK